MRTAQAPTPAASAEDSEELPVGGGAAKRARNNRRCVDESDEEGEGAAAAARPAGRRRFKLDEGAAGARHGVGTGAAAAAGREGLAAWCGYDLACTANS